jgi:hypothetical protein
MKQNSDILTRPHSTGTETASKLYSIVLHDDGSSVSVRNTLCLSHNETAEIA